MTARGAGAGELVYTGATRPMPKGYLQYRNRYAVRVAGASSAGSVWLAVALQHGEDGIRYASLADLMAEWEPAQTRCNERKGKR